MRRMGIVGVAILLLSLLAAGQVAPPKSSVSDQITQETNPAAQDRSANPSGVVLEDGTPVRLRLNRTVSSSDSHVGDTVDFEVAQDISVKGTVVIPQGTLAFGTVTEAHPTRHLARGGAITINVDFVKLSDGEKALLRAVQAGKGGSHVGRMTAGLVVSGLFLFPGTPAFLLMHGKDFTMPRGTELTAYVQGDMKLDATNFQKFLSGPTAVVDSSGSGVGSHSAKVQIESSAPGDGYFLDRTYTNEYFNLYFRLPPEWVIETDLVRNRLKSENDDATLLLAAVHIPQDLTDLRADSSFIVQAVARSASDNTENCSQYLDTLAGSLRSSKSAKLRGDVSKYTVAAHEFSRANFEYQAGTTDRAVICSPARDYLLLWRVEGSFWDSVDEAASTIYAITPWPPVQPTESRDARAKISIPTSTSARLLARKVQPVYTAEARENHIRGTVRLEALISKTGDVVSLDLLDGPIELAKSSVTAVRQWKYHPFLLNGEPRAVYTEIVVNY